MCDAIKAKQMLGWDPDISFDERVTKIVEYDVIEAKNEKVMGVVPRIVSDLL